MAKAQKEKVYDIFFYSTEEECSYSCLSLPDNVELLLNDLLNDSSYGPEPAQKYWISSKDFTFNHHEGISLHDETYSEVILRSTIEYRPKDINKLGVSFLTSGAKRLSSGKFHFRTPRSKSTQITVVVFLLGVIGCCAVFFKNILDLLTSVLNFLAVLKDFKR